MLATAPRRRRASARALSGVQGAPCLPIVNQQAKQMDDDAKSIKQGKAVLVPGEEGLRDIRIVEAIHASAKTGQAVNL